MIKRLGLDKYSALVPVGVLHRRVHRPRRPHVPELDVVQDDPDRERDRRRARDRLPVPLTTGTYDLSIGTMMSMSLVITALPRQARHDAAGGRRCCVALVRLRGRRVHQRLLRRQAAGQQLHRHTRHEPDHHRVRPAPSAQTISGASQSGVTRTSDPRSCSGCRCSVFYLLHDRGRSSGSCSSTPRSDATCSRRAATPRRRAWPASRTERLVWGSLVASGVIAGFAGVVYSWKVGNYGPTSVGRATCSRPIAAVFFGASQIKGRPNVWGAMIALLRAGLRHQGPAAPRSPATDLDRAALPGCLAVGRGLPGELPGCRPGAQAHLLAGAVDAVGRCRETASNKTRATPSARRRAAAPERGCDRPRGLAWIAPSTRAIQ